MTLPDIVFGLSYEQYAARGGVSNSDLKLIAQGPDVFQAARILRIPQKDTGATDEDTASMTNGKLLHLAVLEPHKFARGSSHHVRPDTYNDRKTGETKKWRSNAGPCAAWLAANAGLPVLSEIEENRIRGCSKAILTHPKAGPLFTGQKGANEVSVYAQDPGTGMTLRCRPDRMTEDADGAPWIVDIKSMPDVSKFEYSARAFRYNVQDVFYRRVMKLALHTPVVFRFVCAEIIPVHGRHAVRVVEIDPESRDEAVDIMDRDLALMARCIEKNQWPPAYSDSVDIVKIKTWGQ